MIKVKRLCKLSMQSYSHATFNIGECETLIKHFNGFDVVAVRGTEAYKPITQRGWIDLWRDAQYYPWYNKELDSWFHAGILWGGINVANHLCDYLERGRPVVLTGHSLGGGVSLIAASLLSSRGYSVAEWVGFGSPKIQCTKKHIIGFPQTNYRHKNDPVPLMPMISTYSHNYPLIHINSDDFGLPDFSDHPIQLYYEYFLKQGLK